MMQNLSERLFFQEKVEFLKPCIWFQFYSSSNKNTFFTHSVYVMVHKLSPAEHHLMTYKFSWFSNNNSATIKDMNNPVYKNEWYGLITSQTKFQSPFNAR